MNPIVSLRIAVRALEANKLRTALTMLGMIIGVGAVIAMIAIGRGAQAAVTAQIERMGTNLLFIRPAKGLADNQLALTYEDGIAIAEAASIPVTLVAPEQDTSADIVFRGTTVKTDINGTTPEYEVVRKAPVAQGEFITREHLEANSLVVVLGATPAKKLFKNERPIGQIVRISLRNQPGAGFRVIGVMAPRGGSAFGDEDDQVFVPLTTMQQRLLTQKTLRGARNVDRLNVQVARKDLMGQATAQIGEMLRERHRVSHDDVTIQSQAEFLVVANEVTGTMTLLLGSIAGISLIVGGIGIMNIMLVSVTERTREIGIRRALGARRRDVLTQFLVEAMMVSLVGGGAGILLGVGLPSLIARAGLGGAQLAPLITPDAIALAVGVSAAIGLFFGIYPAMRASRLSPIDALRYE